MSGALTQLVAYGAQNIYLTGNPQITYFKVVYRRHTNFAMESIEQTFMGNPDFGKTVALCTFNTAVKPRTTLYIPLQFWFCRNAGLALPLIALQYHEVKINMEFRAIEQLW